MSASVSFAAEGLFKELFCKLVKPLQAGIGENRNPAFGIALTKLEFLAGFGQLLRDGFQLLLTCKIGSFLFQIRPFDKQIQFVFFMFGKVIVKPVDALMFRVFADEFI